jgi:hypothetical protein
MVGIGVGIFGFSSQLRYETQIIVLVGQEQRVEPPRDPNGYLRVWLFGQQVYEGIGAREDMIVWHRRLNWIMLVAFATVGAFLGLVLGFLARCRTSPTGCNDDGQAPLGEDRR